MTLELVVPTDPRQPLPNRAAVHGRCPKCLAAKGEPCHGLRPKPAGWLKRGHRARWRKYWLSGGGRAERPTLSL
jgi:hypothetical protein